jgi:hypothetical protein
MVDFQWFQITDFEAYVELDASPTCGTSILDELGLPTAGRICCFS